MTNTDTSASRSAAEDDASEGTSSASGKSKRAPSKGVPLADRSTAKSSRGRAGSARATSPENGKAEPRPVGRRFAAELQTSGEESSNGGSTRWTRPQLPESTAKKRTDANADYADSKIGGRSKADGSTKTDVEPRTADAEPKADTKPKADAEPKPDGTSKKDATPEADVESKTDAEPNAAAKLRGTGSTTERKRRFGDGADAPASSGDIEEPGWVRRHAVLVAALVSAVVMMGGGALGFFFAESRPDVWQAEAEIVLRSPASQVDRYLGTQVVVAMSSSVVVRAAAELPVDQAYIDEKLSVAPIDAGVAVRISFDDEDPGLALDVVDAVVSAYLSESQTESTNTTRAVYSTRIEELRTARAGIEAELADVEAANAAAEALDLAPPNPTEERRLSLESAQLLEQISGLESQLLVTDIELLIEDQATVVTPAQMLPERVAPSPITFAALGMLVGAVVAATVIFLIGMFRTGSRPEQT